MSVRNELDDTFQRRREAGETVLIPYLTAGHPDLELFVDIAAAVLEAGADALEIGIPFSDPLLDGLAVQRAQQQALDAGVTPRDCLRYATDIHARSPKPLLFMGAYNPLLAYGPERFCREARGAGIAGLIVPDIPFEEQDEIQEAAEAAGTHVIQLVAPTSTPQRLRNVCSHASGFIYGISVAGVTGARSSVVATAQPLVEAVHQCSDVPIAVGFGIAGPRQAREVAAFADGVIVGSALINLLSEAPPGGQIEAAREFVASLRAALDEAPVAS